MRLLRGDFGASYVWNSRKGRFGEALSFNMHPGNLRRYEDWYQFRDPMTFELRARRHATLVDEVIPRDSAGANRILQRLSGARRTAPRHQHVHLRRRARSR